LTCVKINLEQKNGTGKPMPVEIPNSEFDLEFDTVIPAIGQDAEFNFIEKKLIGKETKDYETQIQNIFIGGDAKRGGSTIINAIADGRKTAELIMQRAGYPLELYQIKRVQEEFNKLMAKKMVREKAVRIPETSLNDRKNFNLVTNTLPADLAQKEASRCLLCDELCNICVTVCPNLACYSYQVEPFQVNLQKIHKKNGHLTISDDKTFGVKQKYQILHIADWCNDCGNCSTFCPTSGSPYKDKPHLFLGKKSFDYSDEGYHYDPLRGRLDFKQKMRSYSLVKSGNNYIFGNNNSSAVLEAATLKVISYELKDDYTIYLDKAAEMSLILAGAKEFWTGSIK
jgi:putative selenate reductase